MNAPPLRPEEFLEAGLSLLMEGDGDIRAVPERPFESLVSLLHEYMDEIELFNEAFGLVGFHSRRELIVKHILDSLSPLGHICRLLEEAPARTLADIGSGAGLPGIPLALALPSVKVTLIERMGKRAGFLRNTLAVLGLKNAELEETEMEKAPPRRFGLLSSRAFAPLDAKTLKPMFRLLMPGGVITAYKGKLEKAQAERDALPDQNLAWTIIPCPVPFLEEERHLVVVREKPFSPL
jgi:16S rRNA (guanine527-N7)-methyltransferase